MFYVSNIVIAETKKPYVLQSNTVLLAPKDLKACNFEPW